MTNTLEKLLLSLLITSSLTLAKPHNKVELIKTKQSITITDFDEGDNGEV